MTEDLNLPIQIVCGPIAREEDGLALSSQNQYLSDEERKVAPKLCATIEEIAHDLAAGKRNFGELESAAMQGLEEAGFRPEYVSIRRTANLEEPDRDCDELVVLVAAQLGEARLIDNVVVSV